MQLKEESQQDPRKKFSMRNKLRKAASFVAAFERLVEVRSGGGVVLVVVVWWN